MINCKKIWNGNRPKIYQYLFGWKVQKKRFIMIIGIPGINSKRMKEMNKNNVGKKAEISKTISETDVYLFSGISGDFNPVHLNKEYAKNTMFKERIVQGILTVGLISSVIANKLPGPGSILLSQEIKYVKPVKINDTITAKVEIIETSNKGKITLKTQCINQKNKLVIDGIAKVKVL
jgi:3-hydroxybutyryl-CoA dehydratase